jgi:conjugal transfer/type IV secretion protein DotA/TraY
MNKVLSQTLRYAALPGIIPWLKGMGFNFGYIAYLMALIFHAVRLLPPSHPYLLAGNMGRFSIRQVLAAAAHNLKGGIGNIDQYVIFAGFLVGTVLLLMQFGLLFMAIAIHSAEAGGLPIVNLFQNSVDPTTDVALILLDSVFQIPDFFCSPITSTCPASNTAPGAISPFGQGLHMLFGFYSRGMLMIAGLIIIYYFFVVIVESASTGSPFGKRFDSVYVPIRLVLALFLLVPIHYGLNSGQMLTLLLAKFGTGLANNAWLVHNNLTGYNPMGLTTQEMVVYPKIENIASVVSFVELARTCQSAYKYQYGKTVDAYIVTPAGQGSASAAQLFSGSNFANTLNFVNNGGIKVVIGEYKNPDYDKYIGFVKPYCGSITMEIDSVNLPGVRDVYETYFNVLQLVWTDPDFEAYGEKTALIKYADKGNACNITTATNWGSPCANTASGCDCNRADYSFHLYSKSLYQSNFQSQMDATINTLRSSTLTYMEMTPVMKSLGWGGAGVWFTRLADYNGALVTASIKVPQPTSFPAVMEFVQVQKQKTQPNTTPKDRYRPNLPEGKTVDEYWKDSGLDDASVDMGLAKFLDEVYREIEGHDLAQDTETRRQPNPVVNMINSVLGLSGLYQLKENVDVTPLSRIAALGRSIMEKSITFLGGALVMSGLGGIMGAADAHIAHGLEQISGTMAMIGMSALTAGFIFFYIIPLMPFMYFFFAVSRWVKTIFEAMVGVPLWALAHLRLDGEGIPAKAAANGYYLLLEIMIRPILTLFGLLLAFSIFSALVVILDSIFPLVVQNVGGFNPDPVGAGPAPPLEVARAAIDEFMYTIIYAIIVYILATTSFKLIDLIPNGILRFIGAGVSSFGDKTPDPIDSLTKYTAVAGYALTDEVASGVTSVGKGAGRMVGSVMGEGFQRRAGSTASKAIESMMERIRTPKP